MTKAIKFLSWLIVLIAVKSVSSQLNLPFPQAMIYLTDFSTIGLICYISIKNDAFKHLYSCPVVLFLICVLVSFIRGIFAAEDYFLIKNLINNTKSMLLPLCICAFSNPYVALAVLRTWNKFIIYFVPIVCLKLVHDTYAFILPPFYYLYTIFIHLIKGKWFWISIIAILIIGTGFDNRSALIKLIFSTLLFVSYYFNKYISLIFLRIGHLLLFLLPFIFLYLGITGTYNIFQGFPEEEDTTITIRGDFTLKEKAEKSAMSADTRTFMYVEVLNSAYTHNYIILGRSLSRGNDSATIGAYEAKKNGLTRMERNFNEAGILNVFNWMGIVGVLLFTLIYLHSSTLALYFSNNYFIKNLGLAVSFHWAYSWIEEGFTFGLMDFTLWIIMALCSSPYFRSKTDNQINLWLKSIFVKEEATPYHLYNIKKRFFAFYIAKKIKKLKQ